MSTFAIKWVIVQDAPMKFDKLAVLLVMAAACGGNKSQTQTPANTQPAPVATSEGGDAVLKQDLERICNAFELSGAKPDSGMTVAGPWLEKNVRTSEAKTLVVELKAGSFDRTREEAKRHNVDPCPMLDPNGRQALNAR